MTAGRSQARVVSDMPVTLGATARSAQGYSSSAPHRH
jgi:hypothetical protein